MTTTAKLRRYAPYAIAVGGTALIVLFRYSIAGLLGDQSAFIFFGIPIAAAAITGGLLPGLLALSLGMAAGAIFFMPRDGGNLTPIGIASFIFTWIIVTIICEVAIRRRDAERRTRRLKQETEDRLTHVLHRISDGFLTVDRRSNVTMANPAAHDLVGLEEGKAVGKPIWELFASHLQPSIRKLMEHSFTNSLPVTLDLPTDSDGRWYQFRVYPTSDEDRIPVFLQDITAQHELERARERTLAEERAKRSDAEQRSRSKDDFVAMLSHELRTPMTAILGWTEILLDSKEPAAFLVEGLTSIDRAARVQAQLIDDLLDMSRIITGNLALHREVVDLGEQLRAVVRDQSPTAVQNDRVLICEECEPGILVRADAGRLHQVIANLVTNALKFTSEGGHVILGCRKEGKHALITVRDDGQGIEPEVMPVIFSRFTQGQATTSRRHGGLGLGLAIVRQLVEAHGGTVTAESEGKGKGSLFSVRLPIAEYSVARASNINDLQETLEGVSVLVVEDDQATRRVVERLLTMHGATVSAVESGEAGLSRLEAEHPTVVVSDLGMPDMDGYAFIRRVREHPDAGIATVSAIALTAFTGLDDRDRATLAGFDRFLPKPVDTKSLIRTIAESARAAARARPDM